MTGVDLDALDWEIRYRGARTEAVRYRRAFRMASGLAGILAVGCWAMAVGWWMR